MNRLNKLPNKAKQENEKRENKKPNKGTGEYKSNKKEIYGRQLLGNFKTM